MSTPTTSPSSTRPDSEAVSSSAAIARGALPRWAPWATLAAGMLVAGLLSSITGFAVVLFAIETVLFYTIAIYAWSRLVEGARKAADRRFTAIVASAFLLALMPLISVLITVVSKGLERFDLQFFTYSMRGVVGAGGGAYHALMGTLIVCGLAALMSVPIGLLTAIYLVEYGRGKLARAITFVVDVMTGIPSIVAGLFAYALFGLLFGPGTITGFAGAVALSVLMTPVVVRSSEEAIKLVPSDLREAAYALGTPKYRVILRIVLPTAVAGISTGVTLAVARVIGETAPLLIATGTTASTNLNPFEGQMATLSVFAYYEYATPGVPPDPYLDRAWAAALTLMVIVMLLNLVARLISLFFAPKSR
ncbi:phosphate ABC transporter permease PstA [Haloactinomyces albus]|uniref:Phosphate transport system permease protein PstA n=1 Tax=Haloactinomyces albus TaxID=1352928 RepID=A0AAE4CM23_9ACTN|nr:phosphate ABC transporter permease PstA [Haloactinomyces albus]MDR7302845.1 phosphate transport system permease protein [Haloactinomyces albus]